jgi:hypothetical protein
MMPKLVVACALLCILCACGGESSSLRAGDDAGAAGTGPLGPPVLEPDAAPPSSGGPVPDATALPTNACALATGYEGDDNCILPPPAAEGFQVHVGPLDYDDPAEIALYALEPGQETERDFPAVAGNTEDVFFYFRQYRMRPGSHHLIVSDVSNGPGGNFGDGRRLGGSQNPVKDNPLDGVIPPENEGIGIPLGAQAPLEVNLHYINAKDERIIQEAWVNFWYVDPARVTQPALEMFAVGGTGMAIAPQTTQTLTYSCPVDVEGRVLTTYGHRHAHADRFSVWRVRSTERLLVYESYSWEEPLVLEYNSLTQNPPSDAATRTDGGYSGILDLLPGDALEWECEINNTSDVTLRFANLVYEGEMCILVGDTLGASVACELP